MSKENDPITKIDYRRMAIDIAAFAAIAYAGVQVARIEHDPQLVAQLPSFLAGRIADGICATSGMPFLRTGATLFTVLVNNLASPLPQREENLINDPRAHAVGALSFLTLWELCQGPLAIKYEGYVPTGTFDIGDIAAYGIGTLSWLALGKTARFITSSARNIYNNRFDKRTDNTTGKQSTFHLD